MDISFLFSFAFLFPGICKASSENHFAVLHFFFLGMVMITASCTMSQTSIHSSSGTLSDLIPWIYLSLPLYNHTATAKSLQSCPTLCDPIDGSPPGSPVPGILQARTLERVAISFSSAGKWKVKVKLLSRIWLVATPWTAAYQAPPSMGFSRQEYWSGVPLLSPWRADLSTNDSCA